MTIRIKSLMLNNYFEFLLPKFILLIFLISTTTLSNAQNIFATRSGQVIQQIENGEFVVVSPLLMASDTINAIMIGDTTYQDLGMEMVTVNQNPIAKPADDEVPLSPFEANLISELEGKAKSQEVEEWILSHKISKEIDAHEVNLSLAKIAGNPQGEKEAQSKVDDLKSKLKTNQKRYEKTYKNLLEIRTLSQLDTKKRSAKIKTLAAEMGVPIDISKLNPSPELKDKNDKLSELRDQNCDIAVYDKKRRLYKTGLAPIFNYTPEKFKAHLKTNDLLVASVALGKEKKNQTLYLELSMQSKEVSKNYGAILPGFQVVLTFTNGQKILLVCSSASTPTIEPYTGRSNYMSNYMLSSEDMQKIKKFPIDNFTIQYASGYETYTVYEVDVLINQANCLSKL